MGVVRPGVPGRLAWLVALAAVKRTSEEEAFADLPGSREIGAQK